MIKDLVKQLGLKQVPMPKDYLKIQRVCYADANGSLMLFGYEVTAHCVDGHACVSDYKTAYIYQFTPNDDIKTILKTADEIDKNPKLYMLEHIKHSEYINMWKLGYAKITSYNVDHDHDILYALKWTKEQADAINVNGLEQCLKEWVSAYPKYSSDTSQNIINENKKEIFDKTLSQYECLLLSPDANLRSLYLKYKQKKESYTNERMTFER